MSEICPAGKDVCPIKVGRPTEWVLCRSQPIKHGYGYQPHHTDGTPCGEGCEVEYTRTLMLDAAYKAKEKPEVVKKDDGEIGWKYLREVMNALPPEFQSRDLYNTAHKVRQYLEKRPLERREEERRAPPIDVDKMLEKMGLKPKEEKPGPVGEEALNDAELKELEEWHFGTGDFSKEGKEDLAALFATIRSLQGELDSAATVLEAYRAERDEFSSQVVGLLDWMKENQVFVPDTLSLHPKEKS